MKRNPPSATNGGLRLRVNRSCADARAADISARGGKD
jgi:hypothetical protein